ncbi:MAG: hypothetical protein KDD10_01820 [Phaeodactylibacter sp.]|nr:hypothetical protein [Phaeodactylibacter sp.]MCB9296655.1 hypothetical protein [Lewinellaceae bacterium]
MPKRFEFQSKGFEKHSCNSRREGPWLIFECPQCSYARKWNTATNEIKLLDSGAENTLHSGWHEPPGLQMEKLNAN